MSHATADPPSDIAVEQHSGETGTRRRERQRRRWELTNLTADSAMLLLAGIAAALGPLQANVPAEPLYWVVGFSALVLVLLRVRGLYALRLQPSLVDDVARVASSTALAAMVLITVRLLIESDPDAARHSVRLWGFATAYLCAGRVGIALAVRRARRRGEAGTNTLIVGAGTVGRTVARRLLQRPEVGQRPIGFLDKEPMDHQEIDGVELPVLGASWDLDEVIEGHDVGHVIITFSTAPHAVLLSMVRRCQELGVEVSMIPRLFEGVNNRIHVQHVGGVPLLVVRPVDPKGWQFAVKYAFDRVLAAISLLMLSPVMLILVMGVALSPGGGVFYRQRRVGLDGRSFNMLKFRSMRSDPVGEGTVPVEAIAAGSAPGGVEGADRRTRVGSFLRRYSLDELPQLINILKGDMSFVGPRPERPGFVELFSQDVRRYADRHRVKAGRTGWAQVSGLRGQTSLPDRVEWDNYYIENWSLQLDFKILILTVAAVLKPAE
jgi:exopolysaccharide biosynthesis polyprenyl glycosylphosphotransferase